MQINILTSMPAVKKILHSHPAEQIFVRKTPNPKRKKITVL